MGFECVRSDWSDFQSGSLLKLFDIYGTGYEAEELF